LDFRNRNLFLFSCFVSKMFALAFNKIANASIPVAVLGSAVWATSKKSLASEDTLQPPKFSWYHTMPWRSFDHAAIRRGWNVYKNVCSSCHSIEQICFRHLVDVCLTEAEAEQIAAETDITDGPDDEGEMFERPGKLFDKLPKPYANSNAAKAANGGALPPDLSLMVKARPRAEDYVFALLTGYKEPPAGVHVREGLYYNPYFPGGVIGMPPPLMNDMVQYDDGTPATVSQMAKDVASFLCWTAEPEHDERKRMGIKALFLISLAILPSAYFKRLTWAPMKSRQLRFTKL